MSVPQYPHLRPDIKLPEYETDFILMHRAMHEWLPGFQGSRYILASAKEAKRQVIDNIPQLRKCDQISRYNVVKWYIIYYSSKMYAFPSGPSIDSVNVAFNINQGLYQLFTDSTISLMDEDAREKPGNKQVKSTLRTEINKNIAFLKSYCLNIFPPVCGVLH